MHNKNTFIEAVRSEQMTIDQLEAMMFLFKMVPERPVNRQRMSAAELLLDGIIFINTSGHPVQYVPSDIGNIARDIYGCNGAFLNQTFHKSFNIVATSTLQQLLFEQACHYLATYSAETMGIDMPTYIPVEQLELPNNTNNGRLVIISMASYQDCVKRFTDYLQSLAAPNHNNTGRIKALLPLAKDFPTEKVRSFEIQIMKYDMENTVPEQPRDVLRYMVYKATGQTLIIKNRVMRKSIQNSVEANTFMARDILMRTNPARMATIFFRFKPIFLAFKKHNGCAPTINYIRRLADRFHSPLPANSVQNFTSVTDRFQKQHIIDNADNRELIKLANGLLVRIDADAETPAVFNIRNGRAHVKKNGLSAGNPDDLNAVLGTLVERLSPELCGRTFYLPDYIDYPAPFSEKQYFGNIPWGTIVSGAEDKDAYTIGIHWFNLDKGHSDYDRRVDIDLHMKSATEQFGWNSSYRSDNRNILYSGDIVNAPKPNGAAEAFWFKPGKDKFIVSASLFHSGDAGADVEFKMFMTNQGADDIKRDYTFDPNESLFTPITLKFPRGTRAMTLGLFKNGIFHFYGGSLDSGIVPSGNYADYIEGLSHQFDNMVSLRALLTQCGANIITEIDSSIRREIQDIISLAPEDLEADTLMNIVDGNL